MNSDLKYDKINIELRRGKVLELLSKGYNQRTIAEKLNVSDALISLDIQWIREQSKEGLRTPLQEKLPYEFARACTRLTQGTFIYSYTGVSLVLLLPLVLLL
jgi:hypothetical protein